MHGKNSTVLWLIVATGIGFIGYGAYQWFNSTELTEAQMAAAVERIYRMDIAHLREQAEDGKLNISGSWERTHRAVIRQRIRAQLKRQRQQAKSWMIAGLAALIFSLGRIFVVPLFLNDNR